MKQDFETLNKQIAAFIIVSGAMAVPVYADGGITGGDLVPSVSENFMARYAGPGMNMPTVTVQPNVPMDRYAGPGINIQTPSVAEPPMVVKYAGPGMNVETPGKTIDLPSDAEQIKQLTNAERLRVINSTDNINTVGNSEEDHEYGETKVAPGHFLFW